MTFPPELLRDLEPVRALLAETTTMVLATRMPDGSPRATPMYFAADARLRLIFLSDPQSVHCQNLAAWPQAAATIYADESDWRKLRGVQMMGEARDLEAVEAEAARRTFAGRFPFVSELASAMAVSRIYAFSPSWIRWIDNRRRFGFQQEWSLA